MAHRDSQHNAIDARSVEAQAASLLVSLKGIERAHVECDAYARITRVEIVPSSIEDRAAARNAQSALMAVLGQQVDVNAIVCVSAVQPRAAEPAVTQKLEAATVINTTMQPMPLVQDGVLELKIPAVKHGELNVAAKVAFDTLRAAQQSFHGFQFDGAELVRISGEQYVVVALRRNGEMKYCGAAPVLESVSTASARALMNAVGVAAMSGSDVLREVEMDEYRALKA